MTITRRRLAASFLLAAAGAPLAGAGAAEPCTGAGAGAVVLGTVATVAPGAPRSYTVSLAAGQGIIVDLASVVPGSAAAVDHDQGSHGHGDDPGDVAKRPLGDLALCSARGERLVPLAGEVFAKGGSISALPDGRRLRFVAPAEGRYIIGVSPSAQPRELLVRERALGPAGGGVTATALGKVESGTVSSSAPQMFSFAGAAGQWVELKSASENDTVLHLAGPDRAGTYVEIASNDDTDGLNPVIRRKLPVSGTYYLQVDALGDETKDFTLTLRQVQAPPPPPAPAPLRAGTLVRDRLTGPNDVRLYALPVAAGHSYRVELTAPYDGVVAIGLPNPLEPDDGDTGPGAGFSEIKAADAGTSGTERLTFTVRSSGQIVVRVRSFGSIGEGDGGFTLAATDMGG
jgi:hypothetical protein